jgi:hypothetical protein
VLKFIKLSTPSVTVTVMNTRKQAGSVDCGLFAIAYSETILSGKDPCNFVYDQCQMRNHLVTCFDKGYISPFPVSCLRTVRRQVAYTYSLNIYCTCRSTHTSEDIMLCCDSCNEWYHQTCLGVSDEQVIVLSGKKNEFLCINCDNDNLNAGDGESVTSCNEDNVDLCGVMYDDDMEDSSVRLPLLCLKEIILHVVRMDISARYRLRVVCRYFKQVIDKEPKHRLYFNDMLCSSFGLRHGEEVATVPQKITMPVSRLVRKAGKGSSVVMQLRTAFNNPQWYRAWLQLKGDGFGWFEVYGISRV